MSEEGKLILRKTFNGHLAHQRKDLHIVQNNSILDLSCLHNKLILQSVDWVTIRKAKLAEPDRHIAKRLAVQLEGF